MLRRKTSCEPYQHNTWDGCFIREFRTVRNLPQDVKISVRLAPHLACELRKASQSRIERVGMCSKSRFSEEKVMKSLTQSVRRFAKGEEGATLVEYGLLVGLLSIVAIASIVLVGKFVNGAFDQVQTEMSDSGIPSK